MLIHEIRDTCVCALSSQTMARSVAPSPPPAPLPLPSTRGSRPPPTTLPWSPIGMRRRAAAPAAAAGPERVAEVEEKASRNAGLSTQSQLDLLEQLMSANTLDSGYKRNGSSHGYTIREQLSDLVGDCVGEFTLPLGKKLKATINSLTISQKRNIKRQSYLNEVSRRNDSVFFSTIGAFVILPPFVILAIAIATGYVQLLP